MVDEKKLGTFLETVKSHESDDEFNLVETIRLAASGSRPAFEKIVLRYQEMVYRLAFRFFGNEEDARDATQEVFLKVYRSLKSFEGRSSFKTWLYRVASNTFMTISQEKKRTKETIWQSILGWFVRPPSPDPAQMVVENERRAELQKAVQEKIARLPEAYRLAVILKDIEGKSLEEIGEILDLKEGTVKSRINRGRRMLQEALIDYYSEGKDV